MKKAKTFRLDLSIVEYLDSLENQTEAVQSAIRNTKGYHNWCKQKQKPFQSKKSDSQTKDNEFPFYLL